LLPLFLFFSHASFEKIVDVVDEVDGKLKSI
jgi:hypothetical protein